MLPTVMKTLVAKVKKITSTIRVIKGATMRAFRAAHFRSGLPPLGRRGSPGAVVACALISHLPVIPTHEPPRANQA
jgi:hypothetical protein